MLFLRPKRNWGKAGGCPPPLLMVQLSRHHSAAESQRPLRSVPSASHLRPEPPPSQSIDQHDATSEGEGRESGLLSPMLMVQLSQNPPRFPRELFRKLLPLFGVPFNGPQVFNPRLPRRAVVGPLLAPDSLERFGYRNRRRPRHFRRPLPHPFQHRRSHDTPARRRRGERGCSPLTLDGTTKPRSTPNLGRIPQTPTRAIRAVRFGPRSP
jgi:hypothetical protein